VNIGSTHVLADVSWQCRLLRTEAEISDQPRNLIAIVYEDESGSHCDRTTQCIGNSYRLEDFIENVKARDMPCMSLFTSYTVGSRIFRY
jgi:hypothetical protein